MGIEQVRRFGNSLCEAGGLLALEGLEEEAGLPPLHAHAMVPGGLWRFRRVVR